MSWREFCALLTGLSAESRWMRSLAEDSRGGKTITDTDAAERYFAGIG